MFNTFDHISGAIGVRIRRICLNVRRKPDISFVDKNLGVGGVSKIEFLAKIGIQSILDLREERQDDQEKIKKYKISYLRVKNADRGVPTLQEATTSIDWINSHLSENKKVFIHCNLGRGRGPLFAILFLIKEGMEKQEAIKFVKKIRKHAYLNKKQLKLIDQFHTYVHDESKFEQSD